MEKKVFEVGQFGEKRETSEKDLEGFVAVVNDKYRTSGLDEKIQELFKIHNQQVFDFVKEIAEEEKFNEGELEIAELGAIFHDIAKEKDFENHGKNGAHLAKEILLSFGKSPELAESVRLAIERHMGNTGYVGGKARERFGEDFKYEEPNTRAEQCLYDADMLTILRPEGVRKLLHLRKITPEDSNADRRVSKEKNISVEDAAFLTIAESIKNTLNSIKLNASRKIAERLVEKIKVEFPELKLS